MERTSSLDLFRGSTDSSFFSDLNFLEELPNDSRPVSQAVPASLPLQQTSVRQGQASAGLHSSTFPIAPARGIAWPPAASRLSSQGYSRPISFPDAFLHSSSNGCNGNSDSQPDSSLALLNDDTALGFADDCFRRESDIFLSQERVCQHAAFVPSLLSPSSHVPGLPARCLPGVTSATEAPQQLSNDDSCVPQLPSHAETEKMQVSCADRNVEQAQDNAERGNGKAASDEEPVEPSPAATAVPSPKQLYSRDSHVGVADQTATASPQHGKPGVQHNNPKAVCLSKPLVQTEAHADGVNIGTVEKKHQPSIDLKQGQVAEPAQALKLKLAVQDYQPTDAQAPKDDDPTFVGEHHGSSLMRSRICMASLEQSTPSVLP